MVEDKGEDWVPYKKVVFYAEPERHAQFLLFLKYHDFKIQGDFFRSIIDLCIKGEENMFHTLESIKGENFARKRIRSTIREFEVAKQNIEDYNFDQEEIDNLFRLIEEERGDL